jgi:protein arginine N-methyltransferase 1
MYSLREFGHMIRDSVRIGAFERAISSAVSPGDVVVDIGTGTGIFALMACRHGARHVYAIDTNPLTATGPQFAAANGFGDRITFIQSDSRQVTLPERGDVVIGDIRGRLPGFQGAVDTFKDATERMLRPGGTVIPEKDTVFVAAVCDGDKYNYEVCSPWMSNELGLDLSAAMPTIASTMLADRIQDPRTILDPQPWVTLDYVAGTLFKEPTLRFSSEVDRSVHFLALWFDTILHDDIGFSNAPGAESPAVYNHLLLPFSEPVELKANDVLCVSLRADPLTDDYIFTWDSSVTRPGVEGPLLERRQSTFDSLPIHELAKRSASFKPDIGERGRAIATALRLLCDHRPVGEVATRVQQEYSDVLPTDAAALSLVANLSQLYSR